MRYIYLFLHKHRSPPLPYKLTAVQDDHVTNKVYLPFLNSSAQLTDPGTLMVALFSFL